MANLLYIKASPRTGRSHSIAVADAFVELYLQTNQNDNIMTIDIFKKPLPAFNSHAASAKYKIMHTM